VVALAVVLAALLAAAPTAGARAYLPPSGHVFAGLTGGTSIARYQRIVHKHPAVFETFITWNTSTRWLAARDTSFRARLALHISTSPGYGKPGVISPLGIAQGRSDRFLVAIGRNIAHSRRVVYMRLMAEMNGYWNAYAAFAADGSSRGRTNSQRSYVAAWRRSVLIVRGGPVARIGRRLRALGLPPVRGVSRRAVLPHPKVAFLWVPQDAGSPDTAANAPATFWPGGAYVDWVGTDFYSSYPNFGLLSSFYSAFPGKPFVISEWALFASDEPGFVRAVFAWARTHPRVRMLNYYQGFSTASRADLGRYPFGAQALRRELRSSRYLAYAPEYAHPRRGGHRRPERPPLPPTPGPPPTPPLPPIPGLPSQLCVPLLNFCLPL
jgi:hypothetical protein